ncbi:MAG: aminotransferase class I/II-fold pyridoxal phosphate-dependent enzyme [Gammaproteobacteria bacterium]|nr:aminotransferase class I/II-fold pyridoxal phosphate-dependent enzyme [Gammaproteobacteria bacterium]
MDLFDKFDPVVETRDTLQAENADPTDVIIDVLSATEGMIAGRKCILAGTNNYLGLTFDETCIDAGVDALRSQGTGTTGSRMANGSFEGHLALERELADFYRMPHAMVFSTGYAANLGILAAVLEAGDVALLDADAHASLYDGCKLSGADVYRFKHNDVDSLSARLRRLADRSKRTLIITEGLYSILGDRAPLAAIIELKKQYGAYLLVDEAHSMGVFGPSGRGVAEEAGVEADIDFLVGTFSKSLGATGGFCVSPHDVLQLFRYASRPYIFTASPSPSVVATTRAALRALIAKPELRETLWANANRLYNNLSQLGLNVGPQASPVVAVQFEAREQAVAAWHQLLECCVYTNLILPPASPDGTALIRCSISAAHSTDQIETIISAFRRVAR